MSLKGDHIRLEEEHHTESDSHSVRHTKEGNHRQTSVLDLSSLQTEGLGVALTCQTQRVKGSTCKCAMRCQPISPVACMQSISRTIAKQWYL